MYRLVNDSWGEVIACVVEKCKFCNVFICILSEGHLSVVTFSDVFLHRATCIFSLMAAMFLLPISFALAVPGCDVPVADFICLGCAGLYYFLHKRPVVLILASSFPHRLKKVVEYCVHKFLAGHTAD